MATPPISYTQGMKVVLPTMGLLSVTLTSANGATMTVLTSPGVTINYVVADSGSGEATFTHAPAPTP